MGLTHYLLTIRKIFNHAYLTPTIAKTESFEIKVLLNHYRHISLVMLNLHMYKNVSGLIGTEKIRVKLPRGDMLEQEDNNPIAYHVLDQMSP